MADFCGGLKPIVMLVDDQAIVAAAVKRMLGEEVNLEYCQDPLQALERARRVGPSAILVDLIMPEMDGLSLVRLFRQQPDLAHCPLIILSSREESSEKVRAFEAGADEYLVKLPDRLELLARLRYHCDSHWRRRQRDQAYEAVCQTQVRLREMIDVPGGVDSLPQAFVAGSPALAHLDEHGQFMSVSGRFADLLGDSPANVVGTSRSDALHPDDRGQDQEYLSALRSGELSSYTVEQRMARRDHSWVWVEVNVTRAPSGFIAVYSDISQRVQTQRELEQRGRALRSARIGTWEWEAVRNLLTWDTLMPSLLGLPLGSSLDLDGLLAMVHPEDRSRVCMESSQVLEGTQLIESEFRVVWPDGSNNTLTVRGEAERDGRGRALRITGVVWDITEAKLAQTRLSARQRLSSTLAEADTPRAAVLGVLQVISSVLGWEAAGLWQVEGSSGQLKCEAIWPERLADLFADSADESLQDALGAQQVCCSSGSGECTPGHRQLRLQQAGVRSRLIQPVSASRDRFGVLELLGWQDRPSHPQDLLLLGELSLGLAVYLERRHLEERFQQSQKMEAVGRLAGGIAHDFNNLLTAITGYTSMIVDSVEAESSVGRDAREILRTSQRASLLTRQLLAFSRKRPVQPQMQSPATLLLGMTVLLRRMVGEDIDVVLDIASNVGHVLVDAGQLEQVVMNLAVNARDAMPSGGRFTVTAQNCCLQKGQDRDVEAGNYVLLTFTDSGCGIPPEVRERVFEPFFTTKGVMGTGLGLSTVYGIVHQTGGHIRLTSQAGQGTTFDIWLPAQVAPTAPAAAVPLDDTAGALAEGSAIILVVEDDDDLRYLATRILTRQGYSVFQAAGGEEAFSISDQLGHIDLLLTDVIMPGLKGPEVALRLQGNRPDLRVIFMSGYTADLLGSAPIDFLAKPFSPGQLLDLVKQVLDRSITTTAVVA